MTITVTVGEIVGEFKGEIDSKILKIPNFDEPDKLANLIKLVDSIVEQSTNDLADQLALSFMVNKTEAEGTA